MISSLKLLFVLWLNCPKENTFVHAWCLVIGYSRHDVFFFFFFKFRFPSFWYHLWYIFVSVADLGPVLSHLGVKVLLPTGGIGIFRHAVRQGDELILAIVLLLSDHRLGMCVHFDIVWRLFGSGFGIENCLEQVALVVVGGGYEVIYKFIYPNVLSFWCLNFRC